jgi:deoxycytidylate deaminase
MRNVSLLVIRSKGDTFNSSKPCKHCIDYIKRIGIKKIYYSNDEGQIVYEKIGDLHSEHESMIKKCF